MRTAAFFTLLIYASTAAAQDSTSSRCALGRGVTDAQVRAGLCGFNVSTRRFAGTPAEQARCLLRQVGRGRVIGEANAPDRLTSRAGGALPFSGEQLIAYVRAQRIAPGDIGLAQTTPISAEYFVIHDTSSPNCSGTERPTAACPAVGELPPLLNDRTWPTNRTFGGHYPLGSRPPLAHAWTNRVGESLVETAFDRHISHTKFDYCHDANSKRGLFIGIENIQPRIGDPARVRPASNANDLVAPVPGFANSQYRRLALLYVSASMRRGRWLIPAFHAVVDARYRGGHDDPQNFDVALFDETLAQLVTDIGAQR